MSERSLRVGAVSFLNTVPLIEGLDEEPGIEVTADLPSRIGRALDEGRVDVGLIPAVEYLRGVGGDIVPGICIGAHGAVRTVKIFSQVPLRAVDRVSVDRGSRSSVALMNVLLGELHGIRPRIEEFEPREGALFDRAPTALVIGDRADAIDPAGAQVTDLGALWNEVTGLPFVFAAWVLSPVLEVGPERERLIVALQRARDRGRRELDVLARREAAARGLDLHRVTSYWREHVHYDLGERELAGLRRFAELALAHGQIEGLRPVEVATT